MKITDMKPLALCCALAMGFCVASPAKAGDTLILDKNRQSVVSGTVEEVGRSSVIIENGGNQVRVDLGALDLDESLDDLIEPGMKITARGKFEDFGTIPNFKADTVMREANAANAPAIAPGPIFIP